MTADQSKPNRRGPSRPPRPQRTRRKLRARRPIPPVSVWPSLVTLGNLVCGFVAIQFAARPIESPGEGWTSLTIAGALIFLGMFLDAVDGSVARLTGGSSEIGAQLDSLADLVTFGVAPAFMVLSLANHYIGKPGTQILGPYADHELARVVWTIAIIYICCAALRLARFNVEVTSDAVEDHLIFRGMPSPGAAGAIASLIIMHQHWLHTQQPAAEGASAVFARWTALGMPFVMLLCAVAMVSSIPYIHVMNKYIRGKRSFGYMVRIAMLVLATILYFQETLAVIFTIYVAYSPLRITVGRIRKRFRKSDAADARA
jgi:CDP-diacylglycerol--serine O-phosphatidyltransferase